MTSDLTHRSCGAGLVSTSTYLASGVMTDVLLAPVRSLPCLVDL